MLKPLNAISHLILLALFFSHLVPQKKQKKVWGEWTQSTVTGNNDVKWNAQFQLQFWSFNEACILISSHHSKISYFAFKALKLRCLGFSVSRCQLSRRTVRLQPLSIDSSYLRRLWLFISILCSTCAAFVSPHPTPCDESHMFHLWLRPWCL